MIIFSGKSAPPGVLLTHSSVYKFQKCGSNRKGTTVYWSCAEKPATHCRARATTTVSEEEVVNEDGVTDIVKRHTLVAVSTPQVNI